ncbi:MAG: hypothetical protein ABI658_27030 [Acidimicrobiales bacterium]
MLVGIRAQTGPIVLAVAAFAISLTSAHALLPYGTGNNDSAVYRFQADMFRQGMVTLPADLPDAFRPWMSGLQNGRRIMVFPPGWPALMAAGSRLTGSYAVTQAVLMAALALAAFWLVREFTANRRAALIGAGAFVLSPFFVIHSGAYLSYLPALLFEMVALASIRRALTTCRVGFTAVAGAAAGALFAMRPYDAAITSALCVAVAIWHLRASWRLLGRHVVGAIAGGALPMVATLFYNAYVTGSALRFPIDAAGGDNRLGFGPRHIAVDTPIVQVTAGRMASATLRNLSELPRWLPGGYVALPFIFLGAVLLWRRDRATALLLGSLAFAVPGAYAIYWGTMLVAGGRHYLGPFYYGELWVPATVFFGLAGDRVATQLRGTALVGAGVVVGSALALWAPVRHYVHYQHGVDREVAAVAQAPADSVVVLPAHFDGPWILHPRSHFANDPRLHNQVLFAAHSGNRLITDLDYVGGRRRFALRLRVDAGGDILKPTPYLTELDQIEAPTLLFEQRFDTPKSYEAYAATKSGAFSCPLRQGSVTWIVRDQRVVGARGCAEPIREAIVPNEPADGQLTIGRLEHGAVGVDAGFEQGFTLSSNTDTTTVLTPGRCMRRLETQDRTVVWYRDDQPEQSNISVRPATAADLDLTRPPLGR